VRIAHFRFSYLWLRLESFRLGKKSNEFFFALGLFTIFVVPENPAERIQSLKLSVR